MKVDNFLFWIKARSFVKMSNNVFECLDATWAYFCQSQCNSTCQLLMIFAPKRVWNFFLRPKNSKWPKNVLRNYGLIIPYIIWLHKYAKAPTELQFTKDKTERTLLSKNNNNNSRPTHSKCNMENIVINNNNNQQQSGEDNTHKDIPICQQVRMTSKLLFINPLESFIVWSIHVFW